MAFNLKSLGDIAKAMSSAKDIVANGSELISKTSSMVTGGSGANQTSNSQSGDLSYDMYPERIEKLIRLALSEGELDDDCIEMLERAAIKEGLDPDEVVFVAKKRLKKILKDAPKKLSPAQELANTLNELDVKFNAAIEAIRMGDNGVASAILDTITGGMSGLAVTIGNKIFGKSIDDRVDDIMEMRDVQRAGIITSTTLPNNELHVVELLEFVAAQVTATKNGDKGLLDHAFDSVFGDMETSKERQAWKSLHQSAYNRAQMMVAGDPSKAQYIETLKPAKKKFGLF